MSESETNRQVAAEGVAYERCLCREALERLQDLLGVSPAVSQHLRNSRIELLKAIRAVIDERIEHVSRTSQPGTKVTVE